MADHIFFRAKQVLRRCHSQNPFEIAKALGVHILFRDDFAQLKGMYAVIKRNRFIFINEKMSKQLQTIVCAHELGHDALHRQFAQNCLLQDIMLYDMTLKPEYEANLFAAHILLDEEQLLGMIRDEMDIYRIAALLHTDINLVDIKIRDMRRRGLEEIWIPSRS